VKQAISRPNYDSPQPYKPPEDAIYAGRPRNGGPGPRVEGEFGGSSPPVSASSPGGVTVRILRRAWTEGLHLRAGWGRTIGNRSNVAVADCWLSTRPSTGFSLRLQVHDGRCWRAPIKGEPVDVWLSPGPMENSFRRHSQGQPASQTAWVEINPDLVNKPTTRPPGSAYGVHQRRAATPRAKRNRRPGRSVPMTKLTTTRG